MNGKQPNILFIMTDQMRADALGCSGNPAAVTPNLDGLAATGIRYSRCCTVSPLCAPARTSLLAGIYPHQTGVWNNDPHIFPGTVRNWVKDLRSMGYCTSVIGKTHYYPFNGSIPDMRAAEDLIQACGYDYVDEIPGPRTSGTLLSHMTGIWQERGLMEAVREDIAARYSGRSQAIARKSVLPLELYPDVYVGRRTVEYLNGCRKDKPWFCFVSFGGPHEPWDCPDEFVEPFLELPMPEPLPPFRDTYPNRPRGNWDKETGYCSVTLREAQEIRRNYAGKVLLIDEQIGDILAAVEARGEREHTVVIFASDHGEMNGDHGRLYKSNFLESSLLVPLIVCDPRKPAKGTVSDDPVELIDIGPTIIAAAGGCLSYRQCGRDLAEGKAREFVISELDHEIMIRTGTGSPIDGGPWKMVLNRERQPYMLFNLGSDPEEQCSLAGNTGYGRIELFLAEAVDAFLAETSSFAYTGEDRS